MTKIAFIGAGDITTLHAAALEKVGDASLVGLWNITPELAVEKSERFGCKIYRTVEDLVGDSEIDAVFVLTTMETHAHYANLAMNAGKHVLVEKPVAATIKELEEMKVTAARNGVVLMPGHNYIHEDGLQRSKDLIDTGRLGDIAQVYIMYNIRHPEEVAIRYPGVIRQLMIHHLYILVYLVGRPTHVSAMKSVFSYRDHTEDDIAMLTLRLANGGLAHLSSSFANDDHSSDAWTFLVKVLGTEGSTRFAYNDWVENKQAIVHSHTYSAYHYHIQNEDRFFVEECVGKGTPPPSTIDDAILCHRLIEAAEQSVSEGREIAL